MIYSIYPKDTKEIWWVFYEENAKGRLTIRKEYVELVCKGCGKLPELTALELGLSRNINISSQLDCIGSADDWLCVNTRFKDVVQEHNIQGLQFISFPCLDNRFLVRPKLFVETDEAVAGFQYSGNACPVCRRYPDKIVGPLIGSLSIPNSPDTFFVSKIANESIKGSYYRLFAHKQVVAILKKNKISGLEYILGMVSVKIQIAS